MGNFLLQALRAVDRLEGCFDELDDFYDFLLRRNRALNAGARRCSLPTAAVCLMLGYAFEPQPYNLLWPSARSCWRLGLTPRHHSKRKAASRPSFKTPNPDQMVCRSLRQTIYSVYPAASALVSVPEGS